MPATLHRALKLSRRIPDGERILAHLATKAVRTTLIRAADEGVPPVERLSADLLARFPNAFGSLQARQFVGLTVRAVLEEEGYAIASPKVRITGDPLFKIAASYRKAPKPRRETGPGFVERILSVLTEDEARTALALLTARLGASA